MGLPLFGGRKCESTGTPTGAAPNPTKFSVLRSHRAGNDVLVVEVRYPDCTNFEGLKVLVYEGVETAAYEIATGKCDPHFAENGVSPVARFRPTPEGWLMAVRFAGELAKEGVVR
jgi:hypothetical protein